MPFLRSLIRVATIAVCLIQATMHACTIFVLTDSEHSLFCNNEDWADRPTRIWFVPAGDGNFGCAYVGFSDGKAQGGLNTEGLAYDVVAGRPGNVTPDDSLPRVRGNPCQRMLETCRTVGEAIEFFRSHQIGFGGAEMFVADRSGRSAILGPDNGKLDVQESDRCHALGYGRDKVDALLALSREPSFTNGAKILEAAAQHGATATRYSTTYDLKTGTIMVYQFLQKRAPQELSLTNELSKGAHYYDLKEIQHQVTAAPRPLPANCVRFPLDQMLPIVDPEPKTTDHLKSIFEDTINGSMKASNFTPAAWKRESATPKQSQAFLQKLGALQNLCLVERQAKGNRQELRYRVHFTNADLLYFVVFDHQQFDTGQIEDLKWVSGAP